MFSQATHAGVHRRKIVQYFGEYNKNKMDIVWALFMRSYFTFVLELVSLAVQCLPYIPDKLCAKFYDDHLISWNVKAYSSM